MSGRSSGYSRKRKAPTTYKKRQYSKSTRTGSRYWAYDAPRPKFTSSGVKNALKSMMELKQYYHTVKCHGAVTSSHQFNEAYEFNEKGFTQNEAQSVKPTMELMHLITQNAAGNGAQAYNTRIGNKITIKSIDFRFLWSGILKRTDGGNDPDFPLGSHTVGDRTVWIILDKTPNGAAPKLGDIFHGTFGWPTAQKHSKNENRFQILKTFICPSLGKEPDSKNKFMYYKFKKPLQVRYQSSAGSITDVVENAIWVLISNVSAPVYVVADLVDNTLKKCGPGVYGDINVRFYDA